MDGGAESGLWQRQAALYFIGIGFIRHWRCHGRAGMWRLLGVGPPREDIV